MAFRGIKSKIKRKFEQRAEKKRTQARPGRKNPANVAQGVDASKTAVTSKAQSTIRKGETPAQHKDRTQRATADQRIIQAKRGIITNKGKFQGQDIVTGFKNKEDVDTANAKVPPNPFNITGQPIDPNKPSLVPQETTPEGKTVLGTTFTPNDLGEGRFDPSTSKSRKQLAIMAAAGAVIITSAGLAFPAATAAAAGTLTSTEILGLQAAGTAAVNTATVTAGTTSIVGTISALGLAPKIAAAAFVAVSEK
jgi:hypothetical protein